MSQLQKDLRAARRNEFQYGPLLQHVRARAKRIQAIRDAREQEEGRKMARDAWKTFKPIVMMTEIFAVVVGFAASFQASSPAPQPSAPSQYTYHQPTTGQGPNVPYSPIDLESMLKAQKTYAEDSFNAQKDFTVRKDESSMHIATGLRTGLSALRVMPTPAAIEVVTDEKGNLRIVSDEVKPVTPLLQLASFVENSRPR
jgi:hypothetical protein